MAVDADPHGPVGNVCDKYGTRNPVARILVQRFLDVVGSLYRGRAPRTVADVGCGEGLLASHLIKLHRPQRFEACDLTLERVVEGIDPLIHFSEASIYDLPFASGEFDLVVCCEVLEHLERPAEGLRELARVSRGSVLISVPREPLWRLLNIVRGRYLGDFGNTPGHIQHFSGRGFEDLARGGLRSEAVRRPIPWTVILGSVVD